jgi:hypothetical protein
LTTKRERTPAQLANDEKLRQKRIQSAAEREAGQVPQVFGARTTTGPEDARDEVQQFTSISTEGEVSAQTTIVDAIDPDQAKSLIETEAFMNEKVLIEVEPGDGEGAPAFIPAGHNGLMQWIQVGKQILVRRKFLYSLLTAKSARLQSDFGKDAAGREFNRLDGPKRNTHRVIILEDTQRGREAYRAWAQMA